MEKGPRVFIALLAASALLPAGRLAADQLDSRLSTCPEPYLAILFSEPDYKGRADVIAEEGRVVRPRDLSSFRLAPGFRLRMWPGDTREGSEFWVFGEDARDLKLLDLPGKVRQVRVERRPFVPRPRAFMAIFGTQELTRDEHDDDWRYVRTHVDGVWSHGMGGEGRQLLRKVRTRTVLRENAFSWHSPGEKKWTPWDRMNEGVDLGVEREGVALHRGFSYYGGQGPYTSSEWSAEDVRIARAEYVRNPKIPAGQGFREVYVGVLNGLHEGTEKHPPGLEAAVGEADGLWVEGGRVPLFPNGDWLLAVRKARSKPEGKLVWSGSELHGGRQEADIERFKCAYYGLEAQQLLRPRDVIMLINYHGQIPTHPEVDPATRRPAATFTGVFYWLLHQGVPDRKRAVDFAKEYLRGGDAASAWVVLDRMDRYVSEGEVQATDDDRRRVAAAAEPLRRAGELVKRKDGAGARRTLEAAIRLLEGAAPPGRSTGGKEP